MWRWVASCALGVAITGAAIAPRTLAASQPKLTEAQRIAIIRALIAEVGIARQPLPPDKHGVVINPEGQILNGSDVQQALLDRGDSAPRGARVAITAIEFKSDRVVFTINGGPHKTHWYDHVHIGLSGNMSPTQTTVQGGPHGSLITLQFAHDVPPLTPEQVKHYLSPLIDWDPPSKAMVMVQPLPAPVKEAIKNHKVLVGMTKQMVVAALGRTGNKSGSTDAQGQPVEDWVYGQPPESTFVRFQGIRVIRVTVWHNGAETVSTQAPPELSAAIRRHQQQDAQVEQEASQPAPTLRRPGDAPPPKPMPGSSTPPMLPQQQPPPSPPGSTTNPQQNPQFPPVICCGGRPLDQ